MGKLAPPLILADDDSYASREYQLEQEVAINSGIGQSFASLDFSGSNLTSLTTRLHNQLQGLQGGAAGEMYHLTAAQYAAIPVRLTIDNTGTVINGTGATVVKNSTGNYTITLTVLKSSANYTVQITVNGALLSSYITAQTTTAFTVNIATPTGTATDPTKFYVTVS